MSEYLETGTAEDDFKEGIFDPEPELVENDDLDLDFALFRVDELLEDIDGAVVNGCGLVGIVPWTSQASSSSGSAASCSG
jgi:hypothetical protein